MNQTKVDIGGKLAVKEALKGFNGFHPIGRNGQAKEIASTIT